MTGYACETLLVEVAEDSVDAAKAILQACVDSAANDTGYPENAALWQSNAQVQVQGNCLCMIALPDGYTIPENVFALGRESASGAAPKGAAPSLFHSFRQSTACRTESGGFPPCPFGGIRVE